MKYITVFYANQVLLEADNPMAGMFIGLPDGAYVYFENSRKPSPKSVFAPRGWYRKDLTPVLPEDVPKELLLLKLLMT